MDQTLEQAIEDLRSGNQQGFRIIYDQTHDYVYSQARMLLRNESDAGDLVQEVYINAYNSIQSLQDNKKIYSWLGGIAFRQATKILRKQRDVLLSDDEGTLFDMVVELDPDVQPEHAMDKEYTQEVIAELIERLPPLQQAALTAFYYDELSIRQIAQAYDCSENTIKSRLNYAKKSLKEYVLEKEKKEGIKLYSLCPAVLLAALSFRLSQESMPVGDANAVYGGITQSLSLSEPATAVAKTTAAAGQMNTAVSNVSKATMAGKVTAGAVVKATSVKTAAVAISAVVAVTSLGGSIYMINKLHSVKDSYNKESVRQEEQIKKLQSDMVLLQHRLDEAESEKAELNSQLGEKENQELSMSVSEVVAETERIDTSDTVSMTTAVNKKEDKIEKPKETTKTQVSMTGETTQKPVKKEETKEQVTTVKMTEKPTQESVSSDETPFELEGPLEFQVE